MYDHDFYEFVAICFGFSCIFAALWFLGSILRKKSLHGERVYHTYTYRHEEPTTPRPEPPQGSEPEKTQDPDLAYVHRMNLKYEGSELMRIKGMLMQELYMMQKFGPQKDVAVVFDTCTAYGFMIPWAQWKMETPCIVSAYQRPFLSQKHHILLYSPLNRLEKNIARQLAANSWEPAHVTVDYTALKKSMTGTTANFETPWGACINLDDFIELRYDLEKNGSQMGGFNWRELRTEIIDAHQSIIWPAHEAALKAKQKEIEDVQAAIDEWQKEFAETTPKSATGNTHGDNSTARDHAEDRRSSAENDERDFWRRPAIQEAIARLDRRFAECCSKLRESN